MEKKSKFNIVNIATIVTMILMLLGFLFGEGIMNKRGDNKPKKNDTIIVTEEVFFIDTIFIQNPISPNPESSKPSSNYEIISEPISLTIVEDPLPIQNKFLGIFLNNKKISNESILNDILSYIDTSSIQSIKIQYIKEGKELNNKFRLEKCLFSFSIGDKNYNDNIVKPLRTRKEEEVVLQYIDTTITANIITILKNQ